MILFVAFIMAFSGKLWSTIAFIFSGLLLIHVLNVLRIVLLIIGLLYYKPLENLMHDIVFPLVIYGVVFILWVIWVNKFSNYAKKPA
jgi:exosortase family protein XrtF